MRKSRKERDELPKKAAKKQTSPRSSPRRKAAASPAKSLSGPPSPKKTPTKPSPFKSAASLKSPISKKGKGRGKSSAKGKKGKVSDAEREDHSSDPAFDPHEELENIVIFFPLTFLFLDPYPYPPFPFHSLAVTSPARDRAAFRRSL